MALASDFMNAMMERCQPDMLPPMRQLPLILALLSPVTSSGQTQITLGIGDQPPRPDFGKSIPYHTSEIQFAVKAPPGLSRYRLKGHDSEWIERSGEMYFLVRFLNENGDQIAQKSFLVKGKSNGWEGSEEISIANDRHEKIIAPPDARNVVIAISSAGPATAVGTVAISDLSVSAKSAADIKPRELIGSGTSTEWAKGGTRPSMASIRTDDDGTDFHIITDNDITGHADWRTVANSTSQIIPGETLNLEWRESFCTGMGDPFIAKYPRLPAGTYQFEIEAFGFAGKSPGEFTVFPIRVAPPFWKSPWYWAGFALIAIAISSLLGRHLIRKRIQLHLREARMIADERLRIARDLHDDLGARLSHISLLGSHAMNSAHDPEIRRTFGEITSMSRELITSLSESVWMLNSKNDRLESLIDYLCRMVDGLCRPLDIRCRIEAVSPPEDQPITGEFRHHVTMCVKEAVNNALKHSGSTEIRLKIKLNSPGLEIHVSDNGSGISHSARQGNGLENIRQRMSQLGGNMKIGNADDGGFTIHLQVPLPPLSARAS